ncbi:hypothetical protein Pmani_016259, partial [Petrolisthes manimaculis]
GDVMSTVGVKEVARPPPPLLTPHPTPTPPHTP